MTVPLCVLHGSCACVSDDCSDIAVRLQDVAPLLLQKVSSALELVKQVVQESDDKKKGARRPESLMLLLQVSVQAQRVHAGSVGRRSWPSLLTLFLFPCPLLCCSF
jgi:hypothetical protein